MANFMDFLVGSIGTMILLLAMQSSAPPAKTAPAAITLTRADGSCIATRQESIGRSGGRWKLCDKSTWDEAMDQLKAQADACAAPAK